MGAAKARTTGMNDLIRAFRVIGKSLLNLSDERTSITPISLTARARLPQSAADIFPRVRRPLVLRDSRYIAGILSTSDQQAYLALDSNRYKCCESVDTCVF